MDHVSYAKCRQAARSVRYADCGVQAITHLRPRSARGLTRSRGPLSLVLYRAGLEDRLVWQSPTAFAVLELPGGRRPPNVPTGLKRWLLRIADRHWDVLMLAAPPVLALLVAFVLAMLGVYLWIGLWLAVGAVAYIALAMTARVFTDGAMMARVLGRTPRPQDEIAAESLPGWNWSVPLLHDARDRAGRGMVDLTVSHMRQLVRLYARGGSQEWGGEPEAINVRDVLVFQLDGVTTQAMRSVVRAVLKSPYGADSRVLVRLPDDPATGLRRPRPDRGGFLPVYLLGVAVVLPVCAMVVMGEEQRLCAATTCVGRPADFGSAVHWLAWQLAFRDPPGLSAQAMPSLVLGWLMSALGLMTLVVAFVSASAVVGAQRVSHDTFDKTRGEHLNHSRVLLLTVTDTELAAVLDTVRTANGQEPQPRFEGNHVIFEAGTVSKARIGVVQAPRQGATDTILAAAETIRRWQPDYVIMVGICYGLGDAWTPPQRLGDVLISATVHDLDRKVVFDEREEPQGARVPAPSVMVTRLKAARYNWPESADGDVQVFSGLMLASGVLVSSKEYRARLIAENSRAIGGEMEGHGLYAAASEAGVPWIVVKAISDWGMARDTHYEPALAARNAASLVVHALSIAAFDVTDRQ